MVRDAVRILCQSAVPHYTRLSIEALFGITVDDGKDHIIFGINELIDAADEETHRPEEQDEDIEAGTVFPSCSLQETSVNKNHFDDSIAFDEQYKQSISYQAVVEKKTSVVSYNVGQYDTFPHNNITSSYAADQYVAADGTYSGCEDVDSGHQSVFGQMVVSSGQQRGRGRGRGRPPGLRRASRQSLTSVRILPTLKQEHGSEVCAIADDKRRSLDAIDVSHITVYTCHRCGKQLKHLSSFLRHKKSHLGIIYRCDGCGKNLSRSDHLAAHQRICPAALQQAPLD